MPTSTATPSRPTRRKAAPVVVRKQQSDRGFNPAVEDWLNGWAVEWRLLPYVPISEFDVERSLRNQARLGDPVDTEFVDRYAEAMKGGAQFPAVVASRSSGGKLVIIDGNHRMMAAKAVYESTKDHGFDLAVYEVTARAMTVTTMTLEANVTHGKATSEEERVHHALFLIDSGMKKAEAAKRMNVSVGKVNKASLVVAAQRRADAAGVHRKDWDAIPDAARNRLSQITTDEALAASVALVIEAGLQTVQVFDLVAMVNDTKSAAKQLAVVRNQRDVYSEHIQDVKAGTAPGKGKRIRSPKSALAMAMGQMLTWPANEVIVESLGEHEREEYAPRLDEAIDRLTRLRKLLTA